MMHVKEHDLSKNSELIAFRLGGQEFCVDIMSVRDIRGWTPTTPLPHSPGYVKGVINLRGSVLPVIDLAARLGFRSTEPTARHVIIVTQVGNQSVGLLVDAVSDILTINADTIQPTPDVASELARAFMKGVLAIEGRMISLIGLDSVLQSTRENSGFLN
ncbi:MULTISPECIES: chemotaxis protein CheW [Aquibium]|jgi:purine-binding chemotaxis protein CheW|uniref:Chemotaxis protein CheW n=1 Tax=Aquibium carbonis TaxID=2495581 RepID=A0A3S0GA35_9HYPH|nr:MULTISPECIES: chemotaxis protein CheW [Aquibium]MDN2580850.1 chemotaxis protein CheW [Aquibium sp. ELW1220]RST87156.1 chemotaxis protein CheW [Aquibium carbonis]